MFEKPVQQATALFNPLKVIVRAQADAVQKRRHPGGFRPDGSRLVQVDVMDDLTQGRQGRIGLETETTDHDLEGAQAALMGELSLGHIKTHVPRTLDLGVKTEGRFGIDEAAHEPGRSDAIHMHTGPGDPGPSLEQAGVDGCAIRFGGQGVHT
ncbi:hypothetical protein DSECCO2_590950 [anaerobic digester metagenome]